MKYFMLIISIMSYIMSVQNALQFYNFSPHQPSCCKKKSKMERSTQRYCMMEWYELKKLSTKYMTIQNFEKLLLALTIFWQCSKSNLRLYNLRSYAQILCLFTHKRANRRQNFFTHFQNFNIKSLKYGLKMLETVSHLSWAFLNIKHYKFKPIFKFSKFRT